MPLTGSDARLFSLPGGEKVSSEARGRDPRNGIPHFLRFKLSHLLTRSYSLERNLHGRLNNRAFIRRRNRSDQHRLMVGRQATGHELIYSAPVFHTQNEPIDSYDDGGVVDPSAFFGPGDIGLLRDDEQHCVTFTPGAPVANFHSKEPEPIKPPTLGFQLIDELAVVFERGRRYFGQAFFETLIEELRNLSRQIDKLLLAQNLFTHDGPARDDSHHESAIRASRIARVLLDSQIILLQKSVLNRTACLLRPN